MFTRKTVEQMVARMVRWGRGTSKNLTDFRPGSKIRTIYEAVALIIEDMYDHIYRTMKVLIEDNIYAVFGFDKIASVHATGIVRFERTEIADMDYIIPMGTVVQTPATGAKQPINYQTTREVTLQMGTRSVEVLVVCEVSGEIGNTGANTITAMPTQITGVDSVTNPTSLTNGQEEESKELQKARFQKFMQANARAVLPSIEYGATLAEVRNEEGVIIERVTQAKAFEELPERKGEVDVYIWNGVNGASPELLAEAHKHITGYYDAEGNRVYGYKSAGIWLNMYQTNFTRVKARVVMETENWFTQPEAIALAERTLDIYFSRLGMGQPVIQTAIEAEIKNLSGIYDVKLYFSTDDGDTYHTDNIMTPGYYISTLEKPIDFQVTTRPLEAFEDRPPEIGGD